VTAVTQDSTFFPRLLIFLRTFFASRNVALSREVLQAPEGFGFKGVASHFAH
jgi:hypothetical protein